MCISISGLPSRDEKWVIVFTSPPYTPDRFAPNSASRVSFHDKVRSKVLRNSLGSICCHPSGNDGWVCMKVSTAI